MKSHMNNLAFWVGAVLLIVLVTIFYQPATAKTGSLLVWQDGQIYVLDVDTLERRPVGSAPDGMLLTSSPSCLGRGKAPCWVVVGSKLYPVGDSGDSEMALPLESGAHGPAGPVSWSPDGLHLAYAVVPPGSDEAELWVYNTATGQAKRLASGIDPTLAVAWSIGCGAGLEAATCQLGYKAVAGDRWLAQLVVPAWATELRPEYLARVGKHPLAKLVTLTPRTGTQQVWPLPVEPIFELRWTAADTLLYSQPRHYFHRAPDHAPAYQMSPGSQLANMSPDGRYTVYYEPFTQRECQAERPKGGCWYLGVWLADGREARTPRQLIYSRELSQAGEGRLNADPFWSPAGDRFALFREGKLVHYSLRYREAAVWATELEGRLTSAPVFSPDDTAIAFVTHQEDSSQYHLWVLNPEFKPLEHVIEAQEGLQLMAWLPQSLQ